MRRLQQNTYTELQLPAPQFLSSLLSCPRSSPETAQQHYQWLSAVKSFLLPDFSVVLDSTIHSLLLNMLSSLYSQGCHIRNFPPTLLVVPSPLVDFLFFPISRFYSARSLVVFSFLHAFSPSLASEFRLLYQTSTD